jgi:diaminopimelate epimerase
MRFAKGHGTENDFVILPDPDGAIDLTPGLAARLCDRRAGLGADGVLRAVRVSGDAADPAAGGGGGAEWFMDYRNADGSLAEMCGNGIRVFGRYLLDHDLVAGPEFVVATRGGTRLVRAEPDGEITVDMGPPQVLGTGRATLGGQPLEGLRVSLGNPHLACLVDSPLAEFDLSQPPALDEEQFPDGVNLELVTVVSNGHILMRVYERGSGATRSCGTGAVAAAVAVTVAAAASQDAPVPSGDDGLSAAPGDAAASGSSAGGGPPAGQAAASAEPGPAAGAGRGPADGTGAAPAAGTGSVSPARNGPASAAGAAPPLSGGWVVDMPGGRLRVMFDGRTSFLSGPAVIVAEGELDRAWLSGRPATIPDQPSPAA